MSDVSMETDSVETDSGETDAVETEYGEAAARLQLAVTRLARRLRQVSASELTPSQLSVLASIHRDGPVTLGDLADCERVAPPTITRIVAKLEEAGYVERSTDPADRRVVRVSTTGQGRSLMAGARARKAEWLACRLGSLSRRDRAKLTAAVGVLERLAEDQ